MLHIILLSHASFTVGLKRLEPQRACQRSVNPIFMMQWCHIYWNMFPDKFIPFAWSTEPVIVSALIPIMHMTKTFLTQAKICGRLTRKT